MNLLLHIFFLIWNVLFILSVCIRASSCEGTFSSKPNQRQLELKLVQNLIISLTFTIKHHETCKPLIALSFSFITKMFLFNLKLFKQKIWEGKKRGLLDRIYIQQVIPLQDFSVWNFSFLWAPGGYISSIQLMPYSLGVTTLSEHWDI